MAHETGCKKGDCSVKNKKNAPDLCDTSGVFDANIRQVGLLDSCNAFNNCRREKEAESKKQQHADVNNHWIQL